jgi:Phage integrase family
LGKEEIERWHVRFPRSRTGEIALVLCRAVLGHAVKLGWVETNASTGVERYPVRYSGDYDFYSPEDVQALVRAAASEQDAVLFLTAAMTGLRRGELLALTWRDVDFAREAVRVRRNLAMGELTTPKSGRVRVVPMVAQVAQPLARWLNVTGSPATRTSCSARRPARRLTPARCAAATTQPSRALACARCPSTACATISAPWPSIARPSSRYKLGWATPTSRPPRATCHHRAQSSDAATLSDACSAHLREQSLGV